MLSLLGDIASLRPNPNLGIEMESHLTAYG